MCYKSNSGRKGLALTMSYQTVTLGCRGGAGISMWTNIFVAVPLLWLYIVLCCMFMLFDNVDAETAFDNDHDFGYGIADSIYDDR